MIMMSKHKDVDDKTIDVVAKREKTWTYIEILEGYYEKQKKQISKLQKENKSISEWNEE